MRKTFFAVIACVAVVGFHSCNKEFGTTTAKWVHVSPDAPALEVFNSGKKLLENFKYGDVSDYLTYDRSNLSFQVKYIGEIRTRVSNPIWEEGGRYSAYIIDSFGALNRLILNDVFSAPEAGKAQFRFLHLSPDLPPFELLVNGSLFFEEETIFDFGNQGLATFNPIDEGTYTFKALVENTASTDTLTLGNISIENGKTYTLFAKGFLADTATNKLSLGVVIEN